MAARRCSALAVAALWVASLAGCNAIFGIHEGKLRAGCADTLDIDDLEDGDGAICDTKDSAMRKGDWFTIGDGTSSHLEPAPGAPFTPTLIPGGRDGSYYAARMTGSGFTDWGARMGFNLNVQGLGAQTYNASTIGGITFWLKSNVPIIVELPISATIPVNEGGGTCADGQGEHNCGRHLAFPITAPDPDNWVEYSVPFTALSQTTDLDANGNTVYGSAAWNPKELVAIQFWARQPSFDVWVDDVRFYGCTNTECVPTCTDQRTPVACPALGNVPADCWHDATDCATVPVVNTYLAGLWGSGPDSVWVVGASRSAQAGAIVRWNGSAWSAALGGTTVPLSGVWGSGPDDIWAVGDGATILHGDGSAWSPVASGTTQPQSLSSVWGSGPTDVWAVGHNGTILHWDGGGWEAMPSGITDWLTSVGGTGPSDVWAVGFSPTTVEGVIVHWDGASWSVASEGAAVAWLGVWAGAPDDAWAVGAADAAGALRADAMHWDGARWSPATSGSLPASPLYAAWGSGPSDVWAVGEKGAIVHWDGASWSPFASGTTQLLNRVWGTGPNDVWAVGDYGTIIHWNGADGWLVVPPRAIAVNGNQ